jgi:ferredoxin
MPTIIIDNQPIDVPEGATVLDAARKLGIDIPALCFLAGWEANTSCMACVVKIEGRGGLAPSCATRAVEGMRVESESDEVRSVRRTALELLLSDHLGDCMGPCHSICPARMNIPLMIRQIAAGQMREAIATVKADIALPAVLGRICPAPCEKACRRGEKDAAISICLLKRHAADVDLAGGNPYLPARAAESGKRVAVVGAGPTGLAAAYYLLAHGHAVTIFDDRPAPGGMLRYGVEESRLPRDVLDAEIDVIRRLGAELRAAVRVGRDVPMAGLRRDFAAVFVAAGKVDPPAVAELGLEADPAGGARADRHTYATGVAGVFAACSPRQQKLTVRAVAAGKAAAESIHQFLGGLAVTGAKRPFTVHVGKLQEGEIERFMEGVAAHGRVEPAAAGEGLSSDQAKADCRRCLHCDCRRGDDCKLRRYAEAYGADASAYKAGRRTFEQVRQHAEVIFEPGKCIDCGLCIQVAQRAGEKFGLAFVRRGFNVRLTVPLGRTLAEGLAKAGADCVAACPTGALAMREKD